jgi:glutamate synthase (ferredoxin)
MVVNFFMHIAEDVRETLAELGVRSLNDIIGRVDLLQRVADNEDPRGHLVSLARVIAQADPSGRLPRRRETERNERPGDKPLDDEILAEIGAEIAAGRPVQRAYRVSNQNRAVGARVAGAIAYQYGEEGLPAGSVELRFAGSAGQSFGAFTHRGMQLILTGEANDYVAKGMGGGEVVVRPFLESTFATHENTIAGNTVLYGATGGSLFLAGRAGERFAVRNSGALAVVEGIGDHGCEYMTEGVAVILGETGRNFGAGMSNGVAYVLDEKREFPKRINPELVGLAQVTSTLDVEMLRTLIQRHLDLTGSPRARRILATWEQALPLFWKVAPHNALTEDGPMTVIQRHLDSLREGMGL